MSRWRDPLPNDVIRRLIKHDKEAYNWVEQLLLGNQWDGTRYKHSVFLGKATGPMRGNFRAWIHIQADTVPIHTLTNMLDLDFRERSLGLSFTNPDGETLNLIRFNRGHSHTIRRDWITRPSIIPRFAPHVHIATHWAMSLPVPRTNPEKFTVPRYDLVTLRNVVTHMEKRCSIDGRQLAWT